MPSTDGSLATTGDVAAAVIADSQSSVNGARKKRAGSRLLTFHSAQPETVLGQLVRAAATSGDTQALQAHLRDARWELVVAVCCFFLLLCRVLPVDILLLRHHVLAVDLSLNIINHQYHYPFILPLILLCTVILASAARLDLEVRQQTDLGELLTCVTMLLEGGTDYDMAHAVLNMLLRTRGDEVGILLVL